MSLNDIAAFFIPKDIGEVATICFIIALIFTGRLKKLGPLEFATGWQTAINKLDQKLTEFIAHSNSNDDKIFEAIRHSIEDRDILHATAERNVLSIKDLRLESLKIQILVSDSPEEQFMLYDKYKELGGNGWMDVRMQRLKNEQLNKGA